MELPTQLRANRERCGLSQEDVAHAIYVSRQTISSWENGKTYPDVQSLLLLSQLFGVSIDELVKGDVVSMKEMVSKDAVKMQHFTWAAIALIVLGMACTLILPLLWKAPSSITNVTCGFIAGIALFVAFFALGLLCALRVERIKRSHNLMTYREISAFMDGDEVPTDTEALSRRKPYLSILAKVLCGAGAGLIIGFTIKQIVKLLA